MEGCLYMPLTIIAFVSTPTYPIFTEPHNKADFEGFSAMI